MERGWAVLTLARTRLASSEEAVEAVAATGVGDRQPGASFPLTWAPPDHVMHFLVVCKPLPPHAEHLGWKVVTRDHLIRELLGLYGLRLDLVAAIETKLAMG